MHTGGVSGSSFVESFTADTPAANAFHSHIHNVFVGK